MFYHPRGHKNGEANSFFFFFTCILKYRCQHLYIKQENPMWFDVFSNDTRSRNSKDDETEKGKFPFFEINSLYQRSESTWGK